MLNPTSDLSHSDEAQNGSKFTDALFVVVWWSFMTSLFNIILGDRLLLDVFNLLHQPLGITLMGTLDHF